MNKLTMVYLTLTQKLFIIIVPIIVALGIFLALFIPLRKIYVQKHFDNIFYKKVYSIAINNDYYLINHFSYQVDDNTKTNVDHILFGEKFIYVINGMFYQGDLAGKFSDGSLVYINQNGKKFYTNNPLHISKTIVKNLSIISGVSTDIMIGITLVDDACRLGIESDSKQFYVIQRNKLADLIKAIESRPLGKLKDKELKEAVDIIYALNQKKHD